MGFHHNGAGILTISASNAEFDLYAGDFTFSAHQIETYLNILEIYQSVKIANMTRAYFHKNQNSEQNPG